MTHMEITYFYFHVNIVNILYIYLYIDMYKIFIHLYISGGALPLFVTDLF